MENRSWDWRTILLSISSLGAALIAFGFATLIIVLSAMDLLGKDYSQNGSTTFQDVVVASAIIFIGAVFLPAFYYSIRRLRGKEILDTAPNVLKIRQGFVLVLIFTGAALWAQVLVNNDALKWFTPPLYLLAIGAPVYFLVRLAIGGLNAGSRQRIWGVAASSIALGATLSIIAEVILVLLGLVFAGAYLGLHPQQLAAFKQVIDQITNASDLEAAVSSIEPFLNNPLAFLLALIFFSGLTPIIEETAKSLAVWTVLDHLSSPSQGFVIGAISGAAFGLFESLLASATPDPSWAATLMIRGGSTMMHIMTASLTGWGIATIHSEKTLGRKALRVFSKYGLAIGLHGLWNASVILWAFGSLRISPPASSPDLTGMLMEISGISILIVLCVAIPLTLGSINKRFRTETPSVPTPLSENNIQKILAPINDDKKEGGTITL